MREVRLVTTYKRSAFYNMALDEAVLSECYSGRSPPTLRFYTWKPAAVSIGFFQSIREEIDLKRAEEFGVHVVRRLTGGGAVFHDREITYSIVIPERWAPGTIIESYEKICRALVLGLKFLGVNAQFSPINDIVVSGRKISGNAQTRRGRFILQHGTLLLDLDAERMFSLLKVPSEKIREKMIRSANQRVTCLRREANKNFTISQVQNALERGFAQALNIKLNPGKITMRELKLKRALELKKYRTHAWNFLR
ncbi:MAG: biotin/lipoate A/B protein ligase family protein [Candidatus Woesearchaeota archaeon]